MVKTTLAKRWLLLKLMLIINNAPSDFHRPCGHPHDGRVGRDILRNDCTCTDITAVTNAYGTQDDHQNCLATPSAPMSLLPEG